MAAIVLTAAIVGAQGSPNLSGTWVIDRDKTAALSPAQRGGGASLGGGATAGGVAAVGGVGGAPPSWVITQTPAALTIVRSLPDGIEQRWVYKLDGSESINVNGRSTQKTRSTVAGGRISTAGTQTVTTGDGDVTSQIKEVRWLDKDGSMIVETTRSVEGSGARTTTQAFARQK